MLQDIISLSVKNIKKRGLRSWLTMLGIFIGIAAVVSLISLGNGLQQAITGQFSSIDPDKLVIQNAETGFGPPGSTAIVKLNQHDLDVIKRVNGVDKTVQRLIRIVNVQYNGFANFRYIANIPEEQDGIDIVYDSLNVDLESGRLLNKNDRGKVVLGNDFTDKNIYGKEIKIGTKLSIQNKSFEVVGILKKASTFQVNSVILMSDKDLREILSINDEIDIIVAQVKDVNMVNEVASNIENALRKDRNLDEGEEDFSVQTPQQSIKTVNTILAMISLVIAGIAGISLIVGGVGITNTMYTSVLERTKEIGIMKSIGARNIDVLSIFLIESSLLGLVGGVIGAAIGLGMAYLAAFAVTSMFSGLNFSVQISYPLLSASVLFSLVIGSVSGILPAIQASKLKPVEALRG